MQLHICNMGYYKMTMEMCEHDLKDVRAIMVDAVNDVKTSVELRAVAQRIVTLMDKQREMPK